MIKKTFSNDSDDQTRLRGALIGCGYISPRHIRAWGQTESAELIAVCDTDIDRVTSAASAARVEQKFTSVDDLLDALGSELDFVDVCVPPEYHLDVIDKVSARGIHVLCQKPLAATIEDSLRIAQIVEERKIVFAINEMWKWIPAYEHIWGLLKSNQLGEIQFVKFTGHSNLLLPRRDASIFEEIPDRPSVANRDALMPRFSTMKQLIVLEYGVHILDMLREWFGEPKELRATLGRSNPDLIGEDSAFIELKYGFMAEVLLDWSMPGPETPDNIDGESLLIRGSKGMITAYAGKWVEWHPVSGKVQRYRFPADTRDSGFSRSHQDFSKAVIEQVEPASSVKGNLATQGLVMSSYASASSGDWIAAPAAAISAATSRW
ncbi:Gfo/Idh/MocA family oxidoreductase [Rhodococcus sp. USK13]|jgi:predicted dehydrogenase|uniref:Gfo/Idh/MocA family protein n=1 Tax=Rhodococcus sp. USK13 TaxID=2806442 RepID=UPI001BD0ACDF|nr:Gfo/Idh/MocA family oxidoreductase [Rhodococcus sp. USK13]